MNSKLLTFKTKSISKLKLKAKVILMKWCVLFAHTLAKKKLMNKKQIQMYLNYNFCKLDFFTVQWTYKTYFTVCTHSSSIIAQWLYSDRIIYSASKTVCIVFFNLLCFLYMYRENFLFFFFIDFKEITVWKTDINLTKRWESDRNEKTNTAITTDKV